MGKINKPIDIVNNIRESTKIVENKTYIDVPKEQETQAQPISDSVDPDSSLFDEEIKYLPLKRYFDFNSIRTDVDKDFHKIVDVAKGMGVKDKKGLLALVKEAEYKLGRIDDKEERVRRVALWLKLKGESQQAFRKLSEIENT
jgi:hypothetical protein